jgi:GrpB-like predicted nucleotidyltransferase (UPF0157 family)/GNAT superfamily N-acetyltransferase
MKQEEYKKIEVVPYNPNWPKQFEIEAEKIRGALEGNLIEVHHVGSTSIPGLSSKPFLDILLILNNTKDAIKSLESIGYEYRSEYNIPFRLYFRNDSVTVPIKLHAVPLGHAHAEILLTFRNYIREHKDVRDEYQNLKLGLLADESSSVRGSGGFVNYTLRKNDFIKSVLDKAGFKSIMMNLCLHEAEWNNYHRIKKEQIFVPLNIVYNFSHPHLTSENHYHFVLYQGTIIISIGHIELLNEKDAAIRALATDEPYQNKGSGIKMMELLEKWIKFQGRSNIKIHANPKAEQFYRRLGYEDIIWDDISINNQMINLGKSL